MKIRPLKDDEDLTWHDLYCRLSGTFPSLRSMLIVLMEWREQRDYYFALYARIDNNKEGRITNKDVAKVQKDALKRWKQKH